MLLLLLSLNIGLLWLLVALVVRERNCIPKGNAATECVCRHTQKSQHLLLNRIKEITHGASMGE